MLYVLYTFIDNLIINPTPEPLYHIRY
jgi:hypothetical protein